MPAGIASRGEELISPEGLRIDGRRANETRRISCELGVLHADGSAYLEQGNTKVLVRVTGPHEATHRSKERHDRALIVCEFAALPSASGQYRQQSRTDRASVEIAAAIRKVFEPVVQAQLYPRTQIDVSISLLQADGGVRSAAINATTLALIDAGIAMEDFVCACSAGAVGSALLLDLNAQEDGYCAELSLGYLPRCERVSFVQLEAKMPLANVDEVLNFATGGCRQVYEALREAVQLRMHALLHARGDVMHA